MDNSTTILARTKELETLPTQERRMVKTLELYLEYFPVKDACLFRYSPIGFLSEGVISFEDGHIHYIHDERYDVRTVTIILDSIQKRKAMFCEGVELFEKTSSHYVIDRDVSSFLVTPLFKGSFVYGYIHSLHLQEFAKVDESLLNEMTKFGNRIGKMIHSSFHSAGDDLLSKRELEVMSRIAEGNTTKEVADTLGISELTAKQYVKLAVKKLNAKNRVHAITEMFRRGILS
ncbi:response regulator transcription factor [Ureibacillus acetophenoni]|uniref:Regulatory LuxR family protein n=1 Tax=Ureibacillus acetophenoni TaxID=614649 RepID=A0A285U0B9_9BACL|nr:helix-turn-helix transcriptional regulator [Ureibacillus acetophenoni]SOC34838.1 regulatory LuxR family protein [Ureibacillus acetophenoni]